ncbi:DUF5687 family protein [Pedobacter sp. L105]|uniref:DUF5687 family protein n=1 Tax=Pedobacter sp. L105 TaxID=1641871 RepID=UPI00131BB50F|nr:DUF5687 family protein [Pedobacter sp. L105]
MLSTFLNHQWLAFWRSRGKAGTIAAQLILGFVLLYIIGVSILVGLEMQEIIEKLLPGKSVMLVFNGMILYYFAIELIIRLQMQELPTLAVVPYLHLNIHKRKLVNFLNLRALFSAFNILPLFVFFPFCILHIGSNEGSLVCCMYLLTILSFTIFNNYAALYFKRISAQNIWVVLPGLAIIVAIGLLEYLKVFSIAAFSNIIFHEITVLPPVAIVFPILAGIMFFINARFLRNNLYIEELKSGEQKKSSTDYPFLDRFGTAGTLAAMEIKLILRNKRPRATVAKGLIFLIYGFMFYKPRFIASAQFHMMLFPAIFMSGSTILLYGQFMFGWQGAEFDGLLSNKVSIKTFFKAKFLLLTISATLLTILISFYGLMSWKILAVQFAAYFYNIGAGTVIVLYFATSNYKFVDLSKGTSFNWQGVGASTMIMALPLLIAPYVIYYPFSLISPYLGLAALGLIGIVGIFTRNFWTDFLVREFNKRKYKIAAGFRERS